VVDNGSEDGSADQVERTYPLFRVIRAGENLGFARACNRGLEQTRGRHAMLLNPDTQVTDGALDKLVAALGAHPTWGVVGPQMIDADGYRYRAARRFPTPFYLFAEITHLSSLFPRSRRIAGYGYGDRTIEELDRVDQIEGSALMIRGEAREQIGDLDPRFFIFFEEVDWCKRVAEAGFEIHVVPEAVIRHDRSTTMSCHFLRIRQIHAESAMKFFRKHHGESGYRKLRRWMRCGLQIRALLMSVAAVFGGGERARLRVRAARAERAVYVRGLTE